MNVHAMNYLHEKMGSHNGNGILNHYVVNNFFKAEKLPPQSSDEEPIISEPVQKPELEPTYPSTFEFWIPSNTDITQTNFSEFNFKFSNITKYSDEIVNRNVSSESWGVNLNRFCVPAGNTITFDSPYQFELMLSSRSYSALRLNGQYVTFNDWGDRYVFTCPSALPAGNYTLTADEDFVGEYITINAIVAEQPEQSEPMPTYPDEFLFYIQAGDTSPKTEFEEYSLYFSNLTRYSPDTFNRYINNNAISLNQFYIPAGDFIKIDSAYNFNLLIVANKAYTNIKVNGEIINFNSYGQFFCYESNQPINAGSCYIDIDEDFVGEAILIKKVN